MHGFVPAFVFDRTRTLARPATRTTAPAMPLTRPPPARPRPTPHRHRVRLRGRARRPPPQRPATVRRRPLHASLPTRRPAAEWHRTTPATPPSARRGTRLPRRSGRRVGRGTRDAAHLATAKRGRSSAQPLDAPGRGCVAEQAGPGSPGREDHEMATKKQSAARTKFARQARAKGTTKVGRRAKSSASPKKKRG